MDKKINYIKEKTLENIKKISLSLKKIELIIDTEL